MIVLDCEQGSGDWHQARLAIPTGSHFKDVMTPPKKTKANPNQEGISKTAETYLNQLLAEWCIGQPCDSASSSWMERGNDLEDQARAAYEWETGNTVQPVGFILRDDRLAGVSPDGLVGTDGGLEIKCPGAKKHIAYARDPVLLSEEYRHQIHAGLLLADRAWWDVVSFNPAMPLVVVRVARDPEFIATMVDALDRFITRMLAEREALVAKGYQPFTLNYCKALREDGRWCYSKRGLVETPDGWRCETHSQEN